MTARPHAPLADLHRHLDGSMRAATLEELAEAAGTRVPADLPFTPGMGLGAALARFEFTLDQRTAALCRRIPLDDLPAERVWGELEKLLTAARRPSIGFALALDLGAIDQLLPEMKPLVGCVQEPEWHPEGDVWVHTLMVIDKARELNADLDRPQLITVMLGAVCHDLGKPATTALLVTSAPASCRHSSPLVAESSTRRRCTARRRR